MRVGVGNEGTMTDKDTILEAFTQLAPHYETTIDQELKKYWGLSYSEFVQGLIQATSIKGTDIVLDVATGTGFSPFKLTSKLGPQGRVIGADITPAMLAQRRADVEAVTSSVYISLMCSSTMAMAFVCDTFDVILCGLGTHHMDVPKMLSEMKRVLSRGGHLIISDVGASTFWRSLWGRVLLKILLPRLDHEKRIFSG